MRKDHLAIGLALVLGLGRGFSGLSQAAPDETLFREAKLLVFDKELDGGAGQARGAHRQVPLESLLPARPSFTKESA